VESILAAMHNCQLARQSCRSRGSFVIEWIIPLSFSVIIWSL